MATDTYATRALRAAVFTALAVPLSALGQVVITGRALPLVLVAAATAAVFLFALVLAGGERRFLHISGALVPVELLLNAVFNVGQQTCAAPPAHGMNLLVCGGGSAGNPYFGDATGHATLATQALVLLVHVLLALAAALWLRLGDTALRGVTAAVAVLGELLTAVGRVLRLLAPLPSCPRALSPVRAGDPVLPRPQDVVLAPAPRRGPPAFALAC